MIKISNLKVSVTNADTEYSEKNRLIQSIARLVREPFDESKLTILRRSIDARKKPDCYRIYTVALSLSDKEEKRLAKLSSKALKGNVTITPFVPQEYSFPYSCNNEIEENHRPVIVGMGPAGLFCAYELAMNGYAPILIERGQPVEERVGALKEFWEKGILHPDSNCQFGEGGAGTFSDGKLNTVVKDPSGKNAAVLKLFVQHGAAKEILYDAKPHIGTDVLREVIRSMREAILAHGGQILYNTKLTDLEIKDGALNGISLQSKEGEVQKRAVNHLVLALGHSARDTFSMLYENGLRMEAKDFAVGFRVIHPQSFIDESQFGGPIANFGASPYKLVGREENGENAYSFCMCPGGYVVNASSESRRTCINGMSYSGRESGSANSAIIMTVHRSDYEEDHPLAGIAFQRRLEELAYALGNGAIPYETLGQFATGSGEKEIPVSDERFDRHYADWKPAFKGDSKVAAVHELLPNRNAFFLKKMREFNRQIDGYYHPDCIVAGVESRTSSPLRILRDEQLMSNITGIFPCGEGAGYAGGITSAAIDGIRVAEQVAKLMNGVIE